LTRKARLRGAVLPTESLATSVTVNRPCIDGVALIVSVADAGFPSCSLKVTNEGRAVAEICTTSVAADPFADTDTLVGVPPVTSTVAGVESVHAGAATRAAEPPAGRSRHAASAAATA
jgi:hypothetical protein